MPSPSTSDHTSRLPATTSKLHFAQVGTVWFIANRYVAFLNHPARLKLLKLMLLFIQGVSRSAAVVLAYLIRNRGMTFDSAHSYLKRKRACIKPNSAFVQALQEWEAAARRPSISRRFTS